MCQHIQHREYADIQDTKRKSEKQPEEKGTLSSKEEEDWQLIYQRAWPGNSDRASLSWWKKPSHRAIDSSEEVFKTKG